MKSLTVRYSVTQFSYWAAASGAMCFASAYLLGRGLPSGFLGVLWAASGILSCITQPILASFADRSRKFLIPTMLQVLNLLCILCFGIQLIPGIPLMTASIIYFIGVWSSCTIVPLLNALSVACNENGYSINYGIARSAGTVATASISLVIGHVIAKFGDQWIFAFPIFFSLVNMVSIAGFPKLEKKQRFSVSSQSESTILEFFIHYKWYCFSLLGIGFLGMFHSMSENYMIAIMQNIGGDSSHVGTALFISSMVASPVIFCFSFFRKHWKDTTLLNISGISFLIKAILFYFARTPVHIYFFQLLHITSFAFFSPVQVFYANEKVRPADMVKGQAFITAAYALGCAAGDFAGGQLLAVSVDAMLLFGAVMSFVGVIILLLSVNRSDA